MTQFPDTLRHWRKTRRFSQLDLALEADVSARHISFLETGRAQPSRDMIAKLGDALHLSLATRNQMLMHAGFAPRYSQRQWNSQDMAPIRDAVSHMLETHAPFPGIAIDRLWKIVKMNAPAQRLFGLLQISENDSMLDVLVSKDMPNVIENWPEVAQHTARRLRTESTAQGGIPELDQTANWLAQVPNDGLHSPGPVIPTIYNSGPLRMSLFSTVAQFGTPDDLTLDDLKIELFFPMDHETTLILQNMN